MKALIAIFSTLFAASSFAGSDIEIRSAYDFGRSDLVREGAPFGAAGTEVGRSVSLGGGIAALGSNNTDVFIFERTGDSWQQIQEVLPPPFSPGSDDEFVSFGHTVHLTANGHHLFIASYLDFNDGGELFPIVYHYLRGEDGQFVYEHFLTNNILGDEFGYSIASDRNRLVIGSPDSGAGRVVVYKLDPQSQRWDLEKHLVNPYVNPTCVGVSVAIDGNFIAAGTRQIPGRSQVSEVYIAELENDTWAFQSRVQAEFRGSQIGFGASVALRDRTLFAGAPDAGSTGKVYRKHLQGKVEGIYIVYDRQTITPPAGVRKFGASLALFNEVMIVGAPAQGAEQGSYHVVREEADANWAQLKAFYGPAGLGTSVAFDTCQIIAGRPGGANWVAVLPAQGFREQLYGGATPPMAYKELIYEEDPGDTGKFRKNRSIAGAYDTDDRAEIASIEAAIKQEMVDLATIFQPLSQTPMQELLLDLNYDRTVAELLLAKDIVSELDRTRLETGAPGSYVLDAEVGEHVAALDGMRLALLGYINLLEDDFGFGAADTQAGYDLLDSSVPSRALEVPRLGETPVTDVEGALMDGYKDYALILQALRDHAQIAVELGRLYLLQNDAAATSEMQALISDTLRFTFENRAIFATIWAEADRESLGLDELDADLDAVLTQLTALHQAEISGTNPLGFEDDFLMLTRAEGQVFDSFGRFRDIVGGPDACLVFDIEQISGRLGAAIGAQDTALGNYDSYEEKQSALVTQFQAMTSSNGSAILPRLTEIVGVTYPIDSPSDLDDPTHPYRFPEANRGGEISQQRISIDVAINRIERNRVEIDNLNERIRIEIDRRAKEAGINASIGNIYISYGNRQAKLTEEIGYIEAAQEASDQIAGAIALAAAGPVGLAVGIATAVNAGVQVGGEVGKAGLEGEKERLAGQENADVREQEDNILQANHEALIATILLEMKTLVLDSQEAALLLRQEVGRIVGLYAEKGDLERRLAGAQEDLAASYFANPVHRLRATNNSLRAHDRFKDAQLWMFFALRSLEYKWNQPFEHGGITEADLYRARNARELGDIFYAMCTFDDVRSTARITQGDWFSLKEDYFGYVFGETYLVTDPVTREQFGPLSPEDAFRKQMEFHRVGDEVELDFSTVRAAGLTFFKDDRYLDKIDWVKVRIPGNHSGINPNRPETQIASIDLFYGGISFIRQTRRGTSTGREDHIADEFTTYNTRNWYFEDNTWQSEEGLLHTSGQAFLDTDPVRPFSANCEDILPFVLPIEAFKERSIATTGWRITVGVGGGDNEVIIDEVDDIELYFCHKNLQRSN